MLTDSTLRSAVDVLWDKRWSGGLSNPLDAIEQLSFLLFLKGLDEKEQDNERAAWRRGGKLAPVFPKKELRWSHWTQLPAGDALKAIKDEVFPFIKIRSIFCSGHGGKSNCRLRVRTRSAS